jgi:hypothetical protein
MIKGMHPHALDSFASYAPQACFTRGERSRSGDSQTNAVLPSSEPSSCFDLCRRAQAPLPPAGGSRCKDNGWRRRDRGANNRRTSMYPIPGNIVGACETDVVRPIHIYVESAKRSPATGPAECLACGNRKHSVERQDQRRTDFTLHGTRTNSQVKELNPEVS